VKKNRRVLFGAEALEQFDSLEELPALCGFFRVGNVRNETVEVRGIAVHIKVILIGLAVPNVGSRWELNDKVGLILILAFLLSLVPYNPLFNWFLLFFEVLLRVRRLVIVSF
jgi:hypothetical protein